jgi:hypothetical protein
VSIAVDQAGLMLPYGTVHREVPLFLYGKHTCDDVVNAVGMSG